MSYRGTGVFRRYVPPSPPRVDLARELACILDTSEPYQAPDAPRRGMYDEKHVVIQDNARLSTWSSNKRRRDGKRIVYE